MDSQSKFQKIYTEVQNEFKDNFAAIGKKAESFKDRYTSVLGKLDVLFRNKCKNSIEWLETNTDQTEQGPVLKDKSKEAELEKNVKDLESCIKSNDVGSQELLMEFDEQMHGMSSKFNEGYQKCMSSKSEDELKTCFRSLVGDNIKKLDLFYDNYSQKFDGMNKKL